MKNSDELAEPAGQEPFEIGTFRPEDADGIVDLFRSVYGERYPIRLFYDPLAITAANREGRYYSICARTLSGEIVGVQHLYLSTPCKFLYEGGAGLVRKDYRNAGINKRLLDFTIHEFVPRHANVETVFGEAVCNHPYMQKSLLAFDFVETAIEVALMPAEAYTQEKSATGRVATLNVSRCFTPKPHRIFLPSVYEQELRKMYRHLDDSREMVLSSGGIATDTATGADLTVFDFARVARIAVTGIGTDFRNRFLSLEAEAQAKEAVVFQAWLNMTDPAIGAAVDFLREQGYFFGGPMPRWFDGDGLLMQKLLCPPAFEGIMLVSDAAKELLEFIKQDWQRVCNSNGYK